MISIGKCIYCGSTEGELSKEHIIPFALNGEWILYKASCSQCRNITSSFETEVLEKDWKLQRSAIGFKTRHRKKRPTTFPMEVEKWDGTTEIINVPASDYWPEILLPIFKLPAHLDNCDYENGIELLDVVPVGVRMPTDFLISKGVKRVWSNFGLLPPRQISYARMFAKIAYASAVAKFGIEKIEENYVLPAILGLTNDIGRWVGCDGQKLISNESGYFYQVYESTVNGELHMRVKLFAICDVPEYLVIVGRLSQDA